MAKLSTEDLLDAFKELTLLELSEFVKAFEETFDVTAAAPVAVAAAGGAAAPVEAAEEQSEFDVILEGAGEKKIGVIKVVREIVSGLGLKEAKDLVDSAPKALLEKVNKDQADDAGRSIAERVAIVIANAFGFPWMDVRRETTADDVEGWDSLSHIDLIVAVEKAFRIKLTLQEVRGLNNVGDFVSLIAAKAA